MLSQWFYDSSENQIESSCKTRHFWKSVSKILVLLTKKLRFEQKPFHVVLQLKTSNIKLKDQASIENIKFFINDCKLFIRKFSLDDFYFSTLKDSNKFKSLLAIISLILTFDDRQALVERGFSINKSMLLENMQELSLISCRKTKGFLVSYSI